MRPKFLYTLLCLYCLFPLSAKELYFRHIDLNDGFAQPSAISIFQDKKGAVWFGNDNFNVYDGRVVRSFRLSTYLDGMEDNNIHEICGDGDSCIYMLANRNLVVYDMRMEEFRQTSVQAHALKYRDGVLFYAYRNGFYRYNPDGGRVFLQRQPFALAKYFGSVGQRTDPQPLPVIYKERCNRLIFQ